MKFTTAIVGIAIVVVMMLAAFVVILRNQLDVKELELSAANKTISQQSDTIKLITEQRKIDDELVTELTTGLAELRIASEKQSSAISELANNDPEVKNFLDLLLPTPLGDLLNGTETGADADKARPSR